MDANILAPHALAYLGDSYYEHKIRVYLVEKGLTKTNELHNQAIKFTSGQNQAMIIKFFLKEKLLTDTEIKYYKKGRNISSSGKRNLDSKEVHDSTGFETLIGYLSIVNEKRVLELINIGIKYIEENYE